MSRPVAYRFKSPLSEEGQWEYGKEPPIGSRWEIEGLYRMQVNVPRTPLEKAAKEMLRCVDRMLRDGEWYAAQEKADALRAALAQQEQAEPHKQGTGADNGQFMTQAEPVVEPVGWICSPDGRFKRNSLYQIEFPAQSISWSVPVYAAPDRRMK